MSLWSFSRVQSRVSRSLAANPPLPVFFFTHSNYFPLLHCFFSCQEAEPQHFPRLPVKVTTSTQATTRDPAISREHEPRKLPKPPIDSRGLTSCQREEVMIICTAAGEDTSFKGRTGIRGWSSALICRCPPTFSWVDSLIFTELLLLLLLVWLQIDQTRTHLWLTGTRILHFLSDELSNPSPVQGLAVLHTHISVDFDSSSCSCSGDAADTCGHLLTCSPPAATLWLVCFGKSCIRPIRTLLCLY